MLFVEQHGGDIRVTSTENVGTEFKVYLPAVPGAPSLPSISPTTSPRKPTLIPGQGSILVVDDDTAIRRVAASILRCCGYTVHECDRGELAVSSYLQCFRAGRPFDAVIMDLTLCGGMEGLEAAREIWAADPSARVIVSSGSVTDEVQKTFVDQGCFAILPKPYEAGDLSEVVHRATTAPRSSLV
jgi:two-component system, cell cycle sensor histidine kinase and response regulator CckA